jgi:lipopolysaccharide transport system ATP-binding protein
MLRYEDLLQDPVAQMTSVARLFQLDDAPETIEAIVAAHAFRRLSGGRAQGQNNPDSFFRKGVAGDWRNYFTPALRQLYKAEIGDFLVAYGYEKDDNW